MNTNGDNTREFNDTGLCIPHLHYMANRSAKVKDLVQMAEKGKYFTINRPRQHGKTTLLYLLEKEMEKKDYRVFRISFEGVGDKLFSCEDLFAPAFLKMLHKKLKPQEEKIAGYLLIFDLRKESGQSNKWEKLEVSGKTIHAVWV